MTTANRSRRIVLDRVLITLLLLLTLQVSVGREGGMRSAVAAGSLSEASISGAGQNHEPICPSQQTLQERLRVGPGQATSHLPPRLAHGCPGELTDGLPDPPDIDVTSCHTVLLDCGPAESPLDCGKRALMAGDWELAVQSFDQAADSCEADYGRFLSRLLRLYANFNNRFFTLDTDGKPFNQVHTPFQLHQPFTPAGKIYQQHYSCLANAHFHLSDSLIDLYLERLWSNQCRLAGIGGGPLPIRWVQGHCQAPLFDTVMIGVWDRVDAVLLYQHAYGSPAETKRYHRLFRGSNPRDCTDIACQPLAIDGQAVVRLPADSEWLLNFIHQASTELFNPQRDSQAVFVWTDADGNGAASPSDRVQVRWCDLANDHPTLPLADASVAAQWTYQQAPPPDNPGPRRRSIYLNPDGSAPEVLPGETLLPERAPAWLVLLGAGNNSVKPSPDSQRMVFADQTEAGLVHLFITAQRLDAQGKPVCNDPDGDCCLTCQALPQGIRTALQPNPHWIVDPTNPRGAPIGVFFLQNEHPSSFGWEGGGQGGQFYAIRPDGSALTPLLPPYPPHAFHYQAFPSSDGSGKLFWTSSWEPISGHAASHNLLMGDLQYDPVEHQFHLQHIQSVLPGRDHGWYEAHPLPGDFAENPVVFFTSTAHSMQSTEGFKGRLGENGRLEQAFKLTHPDEIHPQPFMTDYHPAWSEHFRWVDRGRQVVYISSDTTASAAERYDWFLAFPPYLEGVMLGATVYDVRFAAIYPRGYLALSLRKRPPATILLRTQVWIANIDGTNRELLFQQAREAGWNYTGFIGGPRVIDGKVYGVQDHASKGRRYVVVSFEP
jgi:hypothetical protein